MHGKYCIDCKHGRGSRDRSNNAYNQDDITRIVGQVIVFTCLLFHLFQSLICQ